MTEAIASEKHERGLIDTLATFLSNAIDRTDEVAASERVSALQDANPDAGDDQLVAMLIKNKCLRTGGIAALAPAMALIGIPLTLGLVFKWQAELVLEIAAVYNRTLNAEEKRNIVLIVTGLSVGTTQVARLISKIAERAAARTVAESKAGQAAVPLVGGLVSGSANVLFTYLIGQQAKSYFKSQQFQ